MRALPLLLTASVLGLTACQPADNTTEPSAHVPITSAPSPVPIPTFTSTPTPTPEPSNLGQYCAALSHPLTSSQIEFLVDLIGMYSADANYQGAANTANMLADEANKVADKIKKVDRPSIVPKALHNAASELSTSLRILGFSTVRANSPSDVNTLTIRIKSLTGSVDRFNRTCKEI